MRRFRLLLSLLLGLSLMTQGMAVAVASVGETMKMESMSEASSSMMSMDMSADMQGMHCMDMDMPGHDDHGKCPSKCCDGSVCLSMSNCVQAQPGMSAYRLPYVYSANDHNVPQASSLIVVDSPPTSLLRPPITSHS